MPQPGQLVILFLAANPIDTSPIRLDEEMRSIDQELRKAAYRDRFDLRSAWAVRYGDLQDLLLRYQPHIVHFSGHGSPSGEIVLMDAAGKAHPLQPKALAALFATLKDNVRCVVLNACYSNEQARGIARSIDCVIGMDAAVADTAAIEFAAGFYLGLGYGRSVQNSFEIGRNRILLAGLEGSQHMPKLIMRRNVKGGEVILLAPPADATPTASAPASLAREGDDVDSRARDKMTQGDKRQDNEITQYMPEDRQVILNDIYVEQLPPNKPIRPPEPARPPQLVGFVGREHELSYYAGQLQASGMTVICGMAGTGKTALAAVLARSIAAPDRIFWHSFHAQEGFRAIIWHLAGFLAYHGQNELWRILEATFQTGDQPPDETLFDYAFQLLRGQGYLLCLDDIQFVDEEPLFLEQVTRLLHLLVAGELALIVTSTRIPGFASDSDVKPLVGLTESDTRALLTVHDLSLADALVVELQRQTEGNAQLLTLAMDAIRRGRDPAQLILRLFETDNIEHFLLVEVDAVLAHDERIVMEAVSVLLDGVGTRETIEAIAAIGSISHILSKLSSQYLLTIQETEHSRTYGIHTMLQRFYYSLLSRRERAELHRRAAQYLETTGTSTYEALVHYQHAGDSNHVVDMALRWSVKVISTKGPEELKGLLTQINRATLQPLDQAKLYIALGQVNTSLWNASEAEENLDQALSVLRSQNSSLEQQLLTAKAQLAIAKLFEHRKPKDAIKHLQDGIDEIRGLDNEVELELLTRLESLQRSLGDSAGADGTAERIDTLRDTLADRDAASPVPKVFLSYASEDIQRVTILYQQLLAAHVRPWMDKYDLLPGENWKLAIRDAIRHSNAVLVLLSSRSINKRGYLQQEIRVAMDVRDTLLDSDIYLIPVRLEECEVPETFRDIQWIDLFINGSIERLVQAIHVGVARRST